jgi:hypothetical protein
VPPPPRRRGLPPRRCPDNNRVHLPGGGPDIPSERAPHEVGVRQPSLIGNFAELGSYLLGNSTGLTRNPDAFFFANTRTYFVKKKAVTTDAWNQRFGVVFLDNPLGVEFSAPGSDDDVPKDEPTVSKSFMAVLDASFRARPLFL